MYNLSTGDPRTLRRVSGAAAFQPAGEMGWIEMGDVVMHQCKADLSRKSTMRARAWGLTQIREDVISATAYWSIQLQEYLEQNLEMLLFGEATADWEQPQLAGQVVTIANVQRDRSYDLGAVGVCQVQVSVGDWVADPDLDYSLDDYSGLLRLNRQGRIRHGETMVVTFQAPAARMNRVSGLGASGRLQRDGTLRLVEYDGEEDQGTGGPVRSILTFPCTLSYDSETEGMVGQFSALTLRATPTGPLDHRIRTIAEPNFIAAGARLDLGSPLRRLSRLRCASGSTLRIR